MNGRSHDGGGVSPVTLLAEHRMSRQSFVVPAPPKRHHTSMTRDAQGTSTMNSEFRTLDLRGCEFCPALEVADGAMTVQLRGEIDIANADMVLDALTRAVRARTARSLTLDIAGLSFIDARGVRTFAALREVAEAAGVEYRLVGAQRHVRRVFELTSLTAHLDDQESDSVNPVLARTALTAPQLP
jgi:anti-anti-sigma factor